jgi:hypothetical protein
LNKGPLESFDVRKVGRVPGRKIPSEAEMSTSGYGGVDMARRRAVLRETLNKLVSAKPPNLFHKLADENLARWRAEIAIAEPAGEVRVISGDWGEVTLRLSREHGVRFAVLNMANAYMPGGGYVEGMVAQEENMFRRTDCHFHVGHDEYDASRDQYRSEAV